MPWVVDFLKVIEAHAVGKVSTPFVPRKCEALVRSEPVLDFRSSKSRSLCKSEKEKHGFASQLPLTDWLRRIW